MNAGTDVAVDLETTPLIDEDLFCQIKDIPDIFSDIVESVQEKITILQQLRHEPVFTDRTLKSFSDAAHSLKSGMSVVGCTRLALLCGKIGMLCDFLG